MIATEFATKYISSQQALANQNRGEGIIIDVREPAEFRDGYLPGAINRPSTHFSVDEFRGCRDLPIALVCQTGDRAHRIAQQLNEVGMDNVFVLDRHMEEITSEAPTPLWSVDRQFRFLLGILLGLFLVGYHWLSAYFIAIPIILFLGLTITAIIDKCYLRVAIARLPWNRTMENSDHLPAS